MSRALSVLSSIAATLGWLLLLATVCAYLADIWWGFDLFVHFRVQYALSGLVLAVALWSVHRRRLGALAALLALANAIPIAPLFLAQAQAQDPPAQTSDSLRVLAINVFAYNHDYARTFDYVRSVEPDVLVLLEVTPAWARAIEELRSQFEFAWVRPTGQRAGMAVLSRKPPSATREVDLGGTGEPSLLLTFEDSGRAMAVLGTHLYWPIGGRVSEVRNRQLAELARIARESGPPLAIVGDFNVTPFSPHFARLLRDGGLHNCANGRALAPTWPVRMPLLFIRIDHCVASDGLMAAASSVGPAIGSDHYPIVVELRSPAPSR